MFRLHIAIIRCGSVDYCTAIVLKICKDCNTPILYFNYALYIDFKNNCTAIVNGTAPDDGDV
jgi:hypothetical protein